MQITDIILVTENDKGTEINMLMNFTEYMAIIGTKIEDRPIDAVMHAQDLENTRIDDEIWTELYYSTNRSVNARYCRDIVQLCDFLSGVYNDRSNETYFRPERCSKNCLETLEEIGVCHDGSYRKGKEQEREYRVEVREILSRIETVTAPSLGDAIEQIMEKYHDQEIVLDADDFQEVIIDQERKMRGR